jgi:hypothetical protein
VVDKIIRLYYNIIINMKEVSYTKAEIDKMTSDQIVARIAALRFAAAGTGNYTECKKIAEPLLIEINIRTAKIAKKFGRNPYKFQFAGFGRKVS